MDEDKSFTAIQTWTSVDNAWVSANEEMGPQNRAERRRSRLRCGANGCPRPPMEGTGRCEMHGGLRATAKPLGTVYPVTSSGRWVAPDPEALRKTLEMYEQGLVTWDQYRQQVIPAVEAAGVPTGSLPPAKQPWVWGDV